MFKTMKGHVSAALDEIRQSGLYKEERVITTPQGSRIAVRGGREVVNFCANNYLGLANDPRLIEAAQAGLKRWGFGLSSVRFICGTQDLHKQLEAAITKFLGTEDTILYSSCWDANGGLFETVLGEQDAIISDELNHASIIDGVRLCKAQRYRYRNCDMADLEAKLKEAAGARMRMIATDGVFSMDGSIAPLADICELADKYDAAVMVDDSHATGFIGRTGRGTHEHRGVVGRIDVLTGTFGKALGGATGGYTSGRKEIVDLLRQRSRPYLFSNTLAPAVAASTLKALEIVSGSTELRDRLEASSKVFRAGMAERGFSIPAGEHPIAPIMLGDAVLATKMAAMMLEEGIYVIGFSYPVVPKGKARIRVQISAAHSREDLDRAMNAFAKVRDRCGDGKK
ncbi:MAG TPA: glycine C-acetyltransferase [Phycisphaerae bacterium]|nr:glycine C-acetyltransferase [Phycisphaerae bacterium]HRY70495.1 glycine C-acetyltransferase [Phycisphaerae bacterium]HSA28224.1 glycine C-acetyltransferase [Phycisphaerae bacterium]